MLTLRREPLTILLLIVASIVLGACGIEPPPPGGYALEPLDGQTVTPGYIDYGGYQVWIGQRPSATASQEQPSATPAPTDTISPSQTPTVTPSPTPSVTVSTTSSPTNTQTHTPTPTATALTPSDTPTVVPTVDLQCYGEVVATGTLNVRSDHSTGATILGKTSAGTRWRVYEVWPESAAPYANEWARVRLDDGRAAWIAAYYGRETYLKLDPSPDCLLVQFGPGKEEPTSTPRPTATPSAPAATSPPSGPLPTPTQEFAFGFTVITGANRDELGAAGAILQAAGYQPAATVTCDDATARYLIAHRWRVNFRPCYSQVGDLPVSSLPPADSARARVDQALYLLGDIKATTVQLTNEWQAPSAEYLRDWIIAAVAECDAHGVTCIPVVFNPGTPSLDWLPTLRPAFRAMRESGHYYGYNAYPVYTYKLATLNPETLWTTFRFRLVRAALGDDMPRVWVTEAAEGAGESAPDIGDMAAFDCATYGELSTVNHWYLGMPLGHWSAATLNGQATSWAYALVRLLDGGTCEH